jgi:glycosyltransferase involved in cell wall biosynthesis
MNTNNTIIFFTKYSENGPSSRYRSFQYRKIFEENYTIIYHPLFDDDYIVQFFSKNRLNYFKLFKAYCCRAYLVLKYLSTNNIFFIEYELFPYFPAVFEKLLKVLNVKYVVDYDDAIFHNYNKSSNFFIKLFLSKKIDSVIKNATCVICGSPYLTNYVSKFNPNYIEIPTSVSKANYIRRTKKKENTIFTIGWVGSRTTSVNLIKLIPAFETLSKKIDFQLNLIGFDKKESNIFKHLNVNFINWDAETEIEEINKFDVGIMPLENNDFNHGKCGFKLVQYMACSLPTISSPLEANIKINRNKKNLHAVSTEDWISAFEKVHGNRAFFILVGEENYSDFEKYYSTENNSASYLNLFNKLNCL